MTLFSDQAAIVQELERDRLLVVARNYFPDVDLHEDYVYSKVLAAEKEIERRLRVYLEPTVILPEGGTQQEQADLDAADTKWAEEPGYDLERNFFHGDTWGFIQLRHKPVIAIESINFVYPQPLHGIFNVPDDWIRVDKKYAHVRMVPSSSAALAPLNMFVMQAISGGRMFPQMIHVRYTAGLKDATEDHPDIIDVIKKLAVIKIVDDMYLPQTGSDSIDGMSQSTSLDTQKFSEKVDEKVEVLRQSIHGIRMTVLV